MSGVGADHQWSEDANRVKHAAQVGVENAIPIFSGKIVELIPEAADAGIVDQNIETLEGAVDPGGRVFELMQFRDVAGNDFGLAASFHDGAGGFVQRGLGAAEQNRCSSHGGEFTGDSGADPASGSGDNGDLPGKRLCGVHSRCGLLAADYRIETSAVSAIRILAIKRRTKGMTLAFGKRGTYNPASREQGRSSKCFNRASPTSRGPCQEARHS